METGAHLDAIAVNSDLLAGAARKAGAGAVVPTCPEWTVNDLLEHVSALHRWVAGIVGDRAQERPSRRDVPNPGPDDDRVDWFEEGAAGLVATLGAAEPGEAVWNWVAGGPGPVGFWARRMAHETVVHRVDAESAAGHVGPVDPLALAVDGIDELFELLGARHRIGDERLRSLEMTLHVHATDTEGEWLVECSAAGVAVRREHQKAPLALRGPAGDLELFLYNRAGAEGLEVFGDRDLLDAWREHARL